MFSKKILFLNAQSTLCESLINNFSDKFDVTHVQDIDDAYRIVACATPHSVLIYLGEGDSRNYEKFCRLVRSNQLLKNIPIVFLTHKYDEKLMVSYLENGADDYIEMTNNTQIICSRVLARVRRVQELSGNRDLFGNLQIFFNTFEVEINGQRKRFSEIEFKLLKIFLEHPNQKISRTEILDKIWPNTRVEERTVDVHVSSLRRKLKDFNYQIQALYGNGYILRPNNNSFDHQKEIEV